MNLRVNTKQQKRLLGIASLAVVAILWQAVADLVVANPFVLPSFTDVVSAFIDLLGSGRLLADLITSLKHFAIGIGAAFLLGVPIGIIMGWFRVADAIIDPIIEVLRPIPPLAWIPFAIIWFGLTPLAAGFVIFIGAFFPILINTVDGVQGVRTRWIEVADMFHATTFERFRTVILPGALPMIWTGLRVSFGVAWMCVVAAEMLPGTTAGLGFLIMYAYNLGQLQVIGAGMIVIGLIGLLADTIFRAGQRRFFSWQGRD